MHTIPIFLAKTMSAQGLWRFIGIWPEYLTDKQYAEYLRANELYLALQKEVSRMTYKAARTFWSNHVPQRPFPQFLFTLH